MRNLILAVVLAAACGGSSDPTEPQVAGTETGSYALVSLDGRTLPTSIAEGSTSVEVLSGTLTLINGGSLRMSVVYRVGSQPAATNELTGRYTRQGNALSFTYGNGGANSGTLDGDTLRMVNEGVIWLFRRT